MFFKKISSISQELLPKISNLLLSTQHVIMLLHNAVASRLMLGFMFGCAFLSMWAQNTSAVTMVMPIAEAVLQQIMRSKESRCAGGKDNPNMQLDGTSIRIE